MMSTTIPNRYEIRNVLEGITQRADRFTLAKQVAFNEQKTKFLDIYIYDTQAPEGKTDIWVVHKPRVKGAQPWIEKLHRNIGVTHSPSVILDLIGGISPLPHAN